MLGEWLRIMKAWISERTCGRKLGTNAQAAWRCKSQCGGADWNWELGDLRCVQLDLIARSGVGKRKEPLFEFLNIVEALRLRLSWRCRREPNEVDQLWKQMS